MAFISKKDLKSLYTQSTTEAHLWRSDYPQFERLMENGLMEGLDPSLPEVNDGSLAASLFKLPKRIVSSKLAGFAKAVNRDEAWINELANLTWKKEIIPNANSQAPFTRKWKDAVRKAAGYGSVPLITLAIERNGKTYTDFIVAQPQDVTLEPGKVSDYDSDVIFWDVYYTKLQVENMIEQAREEAKEAAAGDKDSYNKWDIPALEKILAGDFQDERSSLDTPRQERDKNVKPKGSKFCIAYQRGVNAPFYMYHRESDASVREWSNPDPSGDVPIHFLYCYQDFINPYGIGIVKLAGGTQNVLDYMRQADVLATQLGLRPPIEINGDADSVDIDSLTYAQDALWFTGNAKVQRMEMSNQIYAQLPQRMSMYKTSLNQLIPTGDTTIDSSAGDPGYSKTPAGVKFQADSLSIDDEDFKDNLFVTYEAVAKSMINTHFANMEGTDLLKLSDEEKQKLYKIDPVQFAPFMAEADPETGKAPDTTNQLEIIWDTVRATFDFEIDPSTAINANDQEQAIAIQEALKSITLPVSYYMSQDGWKFNMGEAYHSLLTKMNLENIDQILTKMTDEEKADAQKQPFPIVDPPQIRLSGQIPNGAMGAALAQGGVIVDPQTTTLQDQMDLGDIYKDPSTGDSVKAAIQQMAGLPAEVKPIEAEPTAQPTGPKAPSESLNYKDAPEDIKRQIESQAGLQPSSMQSPIQAGIDQKQQQLDQAGQQQGHTQAMDMVNAAQPATTSKGKKPTTQKPKPTPPAPSDAEMQANVQAVMQHYGVDENTALTALAAEHAGYDPKQIIDHLSKQAVPA